MASHRQSTLDLVNVENVRDGGVIETPTAYAMLVEIEPREWLTLSEERRSGVYVSFLTFLRGLQFPAQFLTMTTEFDGEPYLQQFVGPDSPNAPSGESTPMPELNAPPDEATVATNGDAVSVPDGGTETDTVADSALLEYGRAAHAAWLERTLAMANVRDRRFFVAVAVDKGEHDGDGGSHFDGIRDALPLPTRARTVDAEGFYLDEVWARAQRVASQLPRTTVETAILDSREAVLDVLYRIYRGHEPPIGFDQGTLIRADESVRTAPSGEPLELDRIFKDADREELAADDPAPESRPDTVGDLPYEGRVQEEYVETVDGSRLLQWYVRNVGPIGRGATYHSPVSVYLGTGAFLVSLVLAAVALGTFLGSAQGLPMTDAPPLVLRELSFGLAAGSLPAFLLSLVVLLPSRRMAKALGTVGIVVTGAAIALFEAAYPTQWSSTPTGQTAVIVPVYAAGLFVLVAAVAFAVRSRRSALEHVDDTLDERSSPEESTVGPSEDSDV